MVFYLRSALAARREGTQAIFSLERETAAKRVYRSSGMIILLLLIVIGVYALSHYAEVPSQAIAPVPTSTPVPTVETATPTRLVATPVPGEATPTPVPTPTRRPRATVVVPPTIAADTPAPQPVAPANCPHANVQIIQPGQNQAIDQGIEVVGTALKERFDRYEFKFQSRDVQDEWHWVQTFTRPVQAGSLGYWPTSHLPSGNYRFMLIVIDETGNSQECIVPVVIRH
jgi:hypothetical protein